MVRTAVLPLDETGDKIQCYVGPGAAGNGQWVKETGGGSGGGLTLSTNGTGLYKLAGVSLHGGPPEGPVDAWMAG